MNWPHHAAAFTKHCLDYVATEGWDLEVSFKGAELEDE